MDSAFLIVAIIPASIYLYYKQTAIQSQEKSILESKEKPIQKTVPSLDRTIGETNAICPYCETELEKKPSRKKQCPHCENYIYKRTRPYDDAHIIIREDQIEDLEEQWAIANGEYDLFLKEKKRKERIANRLTDQYGNEPNKEDVEFRALNEKATEFEFKGDWGFARNMRLKMAQNLEQREIYKLAFRSYCHVCFLDINGPNNRSGTSKETLEKFPYFTPESAVLAPGVIRLMEDLIDKLNYDSEKVRNEFIEVATPIHEGTPTPIPPVKAWPTLKKELMSE